MKHYNDAFRECKKIKLLWKEEEELWRKFRELRNWNYITFSISSFKKFRFQYISLQIHEMYYQELFQSTRKGLNHRENSADEEIERFDLRWFFHRPSGNVSVLKRFVKQIADSRENVFQR
jgi:hypothetical protein